MLKIWARGLAQLTKTGVGGINVGSGGGDGRMGATVGNCVLVVVAEMMMVGVGALTVVVIMLTTTLPLGAVWVIMLSVEGSAPPTGVAKITVGVNRAVGNEVGSTKVPVAPAVARLLTSVVAGASVLIKNTPAPSKTHAIARKIEPTMRPRAEMRSSRKWLRRHSRDAVSATNKK